MDTACLNTSTHAALSADIQSVRLSGRDILGAISVKLPAARWTAIVGPNGAGKSTLLRTLAGLQSCEGQVQLQGRPLNDWPAKARARALSWLGQAETGAEDLRALDVVMLGRLPHQAWLAPPSEAMALSGLTLSKVKVEPRGLSKASTLGTGAASSAPDVVT